MRLTIRSVDYLSLGKIMGATYGLFGFIFGALFSLLSLAGGFGRMEGELVGAEMFFVGVGAIFFLPLCYGFFGFLGGLLTAAIYNLVARLLGGMQLEVDGLETDVEPVFR